MHTHFLIKNSTFLRTQGLIIGLFSIVGILIFYPISFILQTDLIWTTTLYGIAFHLAFPFIVFYSFLSYFNKTTNIIRFYVFTILICAMPYLINIPSLFIGTGDIGLGLIILLGVLAPVNLLIILLFTLIPIIKNNHKQTTLPFTILKSKPIYYISSIGIAIYILNLLLFTIITAFTILSFTLKYLNP